MSRFTAHVCETPEKVNRSSNTIIYNLFQAVNSIRDIFLTYQYI